MKTRETLDEMQSTDNEGDTDEVRVEPGSADRLLTMNLLEFGGYHDLRETLIDRLINQGLSWEDAERALVVIRRHMYIVNYLYDTSPERRESDDDHHCPFCGTELESSGAHSCGVSRGKCRMESHSESRGRSVVVSHGESYTESHSVTKSESVGYSDGYSENEFNE